VNNTKQKWLLIVTRILAILFVLAISIFIYSIRDKVQEIEKYGYVGIFILSFLSYATVILPAPGVAMVFSMGAILDPLILALIAGVGATLGELTGYLAGFGSQPAIEKIRLYEKMVSWLKKYGSVVIVVFSALPNPFFDVTGIAAGALKMPVYKFMFWTWIGETIKMLIFSFAGAISLKSLFG
jgi:membrane protein YqaA with SNARE-associated domain